MPKKLKFFNETEMRMEDVSHKTHDFNLVSHRRVNYHVLCCTEEHIIVVKNLLVMDLSL